MISPQQWNDYGLFVINQIEDLKGFVRLKEEAHLSKFLPNNTEYPLLVFIDVSSHGDAQNADTYKENHAAIVFILQQAVNPQDSTPEKELEIDGRSHKLLEDFKKLLRSKKDGTTQGCSFLRNLDLNSIHSDPVYNYLKCNGYSIDFSF